MEAPLDGGAPTTLASGQAYPYAMAVRGASVYWTTQADTVMTVATGGGAVTTLASQQNEPRGIAVDDMSGVYWTNGGTVTNMYQDGTVEKLSPGE
jgi:hypothetical protein